MCTALLPTVRGWWPQQGVSTGPRSHAMPIPHPPSGYTPGIYPSPLDIPPGHTHPVLDISHTPIPCTYPPPWTTPANDTWWPSLETYPPATSDIWWSLLDTYPPSASDTWWSLLGNTQTPLWTEWLTDTCGNITFLQLRWRALKIQSLELIIKQWKDTWVIWGVSSEMSKTQNLEVGGRPCL